MIPSTLALSCSEWNKNRIHKETRLAHANISMGIMVIMDVHGWQIPNIWGLTKGELKIERYGAINDGIAINLPVTIKYFRWG